MPPHPESSPFEAIIPVRCLSNGDSPEAIRFYDTSAVDASQRFLAVTRFADDKRLPRPGDAAQVIIRDLKNGEDVAAITTCAWDSQLGAQVQWHPQRPEVFFNILDAHGIPCAMSLNLATGERRQYTGSVYMLSPDGSRIASPDLRKTGHVQAGYGVIVAQPPRNAGAPEDDGVWITCLTHNQCTLAVSLRHLAEAANLGNPDAGEWYAFHVKWNPVIDRLLVVVRWIQEDGAARRAVVACNVDGSDVRCLVTPDMWARGGHHPNWLPDGSGIVMNLRTEPHGQLRFVLIKDCINAEISTVPRQTGSGHPTLNPAMTHLLSDAYLHESMSRNGTVPLRWIDLASGAEQTLAWIGADPDYHGPNREWRVDPHPAWCSDGRHIVFNGWLKGRRRVFIADLNGIDGVATES